MRVVSFARASALLGALTVAGFAAPAARADDPVTPPPPIITSVTPNSGPTAGGNVVTINGTGLAGAYYVSIEFSDGTSYGTEFAGIANDTTIEVKLPAGPAGKARLFLQNDGGFTEDTPGDDYTYVAPVDPGPVDPGPVDPGPVDPGPVTPPAALPTISGFAPGFALARIGGVTLLAGKNLGGTTTVLFGSTPAKFRQVSSTSLIVVAPGLKPGTYGVKVTTKAGTTAKAATFRYIGL